MWLLLFICHFWAGWTFGVMK